MKSFILVRSLLLVFAVALGATGCAPLVVQKGPAIAVPALQLGHENQETFKTRDGLALGVSSWVATKPHAVIVAFHGMNDYARFVRGPAAYWAQNGVSTYALDQRGFGRSPNRGLWAGDQAMLEDFRDFTDQVRARNPGVPLYILGESMGAAVVIAGMGRADAPRADGIILVSPAAWGWSTMNLLYRSVLWVGAHTVPGEHFTGGDLSIHPSDNIDALRDLGRDPLVIKPTRTDAVYGLVSLMELAQKSATGVKKPILLLYGQHDEIVPRAAVQTLVQKLDPALRIVVYPNGYHLLMRDLDRQIVWNDVLAYVDRKPGNLPSGFQFDRQAFLDGKEWPAPAAKMAAQ